MKKRIISLLLVSILMMLLPLNSFASGSAAPQNVQPRYIAIAELGAGLSGESGYVTVSGRVLVTNPTLTCQLTVELQKKENGTWSTIDAWFNSGVISVSINENYYLLSGDYRTKVTAKIYDSSNTLIEIATTYHD